MKKIFCLLLSISFVFSNWMTVFASNEVQPRAYSYPCDSCNGMVIREVVLADTHLDFAHEPCKHGKNGYDLYLIYGDFCRDRCQSCGESYYAEVWEYRVYGECQGY